MKPEFLPRISRMGTDGELILNPERRVSGATTHGHTVAQAATPVLGPRACVRWLGQLFRLRVFGRSRSHHPSPLPWGGPAGLAPRRPLVLALANEEGTEGTEGTKEEVVGLENEFSLSADGWLKIAPYGRSVKERMARGRDGRAEQQTFEQVLDKPAAEEMCRKFNSLWGRVKRFVVGVPIYRNHPDLTKHAPETIVPTVGLANAASACGMFAALEAREDGFYGRPIVSEEGRQAIERDGLKWISPFWYCNTVGEKNGIRIVKPFELISAGLVRFPNIQGGEALANNRGSVGASERESVENLTADDAGNAENKNTDMKREQIIAALKKAGIALANEATATDEQILQAFDGLVPKSSVAALENEKTTLTQSKTTAEGLLVTEKTAREKAERELGDTRVALANERKARIILVVDDAVQAGRITVAEKAKWMADLEKDFAAGVTALANEAVKIKTTATTTRTGERKSEQDKTTDVSQQVLALANERMEKTGCSYIDAFSWVERNHAALFEEMQKPAHAARG